MDYSNWMKTLASSIQDKKIYEFPIPGTHDSCTYSITDSAGFSPDAPSFVDYIKNIPGVAAIVKTVVANWARTQGNNVSQQLNDGIRYLDLRVCLNEDDNEMYIVHGMYGEKLFDVIDSIAAFTSAHTQEIVMLDFNHFYQMTPDAHDQLYQKLKSAFGDSMVDKNSCITGTVKDLWSANQNVIIFYGDDDMVSQHRDLCSESQIDSPWPNVTSTAKLKVALTAGLESRPSGIVYVSQGILTENEEVIEGGLNPFYSGPSTMEAWASKTTPELVTWMSDFQSKYGLNIVICDWYQKADFVKTIVAFNA